MSIALSNFHIIPAEYRMAQQDTLEWLVWLHQEAEKHQFTADERQQLEQKLLTLGTGKIQHRGVQMRDATHRNLQEMEILDFSHHPAGSSYGKRMECYDREIDSVFRKWYPEEASFPSHLIHVSCTGYVAPSPAQKIVAQRGFGQKTQVTHAYHMGCYAAIPAMRIAQGFLSQAPSVEIAHTEFCTLHVNPKLHTPEQLVVQSLFADGFVKYAVTPGIREGTLELLTTREEILPETESHMHWSCDHWGLRMSLSREVPILFGRYLPGFLDRLGNQMGLSLQELCKIASFAMHPGGPRILESAEKALNLSEEQLLHSRTILQQHGNMSSATLPYIWQAMLDDPAIPAGRVIVSVAFGPGLTIAGTLLKKR